MKLILRFLMVIAVAVSLAPLALAAEALQFAQTPSVTSNGGELVVNYKLKRAPESGEKAVIKLYEVGGSVNAAISSFDVTKISDEGRITIGSKEYKKVSVQLVVNGTQDEKVQVDVNNPLDKTTLSSTSPEATPVTGGLNYGEGANTTKFDGLQSYLDKVYPIFLRLAVVFAILILMFSGLQYILSQGNEQALTAAKGRVTNAIIGLILLILATTIFTIIRQRVNLNSEPTSSTSPSASGSASAATGEGDTESSAKTDILSLGSNSCNASESGGGDYVLVYCDLNRNLKDNEIIIFKVFAGSTKIASNESEGIGVNGVAYSLNAATGVTKANFDSKDITVQLIDKNSNTILSTQTVKNSF